MKDLKALEQLDREIMGELYVKSYRMATWHTKVFLGFLMVLFSTLFTLAVYGIVRTFIYFITL